MDTRTYSTPRHRSARYSDPETHTKHLVWLMAGMLGTLTLFGLLGAAFMAQELTR